MKLAIMLIGVLLSGCVTTNGDVKQAGSGVSESCVMVYSNKAAYGITGRLTKMSSVGDRPVAATINLNKKRLYMGDSLEGISCKQHRSNYLWNCPDLRGLHIISIFNDTNKTATYHQLNSDTGVFLDFIKPRWKFVSCPE